MNQDVKNSTTNAYLKDRLYNSIILIIESWMHKLKTGLEASSIENLVNYETNSDFSNNLNIYIKRSDVILTCLQSVHKYTTGYVDYISPCMYSLTFNLADKCINAMIKLQKDRKFTQYLYQANKMRKNQLSGNKKNVVEERFKESNFE